MRKSLRGVVEEIFSTPPSPPQRLEYLGQEMLKNFPVKALMINLGVGTQVNLPAKYLVKLVIKQFLPEILPAMQHREGTSKVFIHPN